MAGHDRVERKVELVFLKAVSIADLIPPGAWRRFFRKRKREFGGDFTPKLQLLLNTLAFLPHKVLRVCSSFVRV